MILELSKKALCFLIITLLPHLNFFGSLAVHTRGAAPRSSNVPHRGALYLIPGPGLLPQQQGGEAGHDAGQGIIQEPTLPHALCIGADEAGHTECSTQTDTAVSTEVKQSLVPTHAAKPSLIIDKCLDVTQSQAFI